MLVGFVYDAALLMDDPCIYLCAFHFHVVDENSFLVSAKSFQSMICHQM